MLDVPVDMLRQAIAVYLSRAYPSGQFPEAVQERVRLDYTRPSVELLHGPSFERYVAEAPFRCTVYALRLGSQDYPHLKMEIRPFPNPLGFVFWVNTHDQFVAPDAKIPDADRWRLLLRRNRDLKQAVERAWAELKLPTFATAMHESMNDPASQAISLSSPNS